jgi:hypothetical protein
MVYKRTITKKIIIYRKEKETKLFKIQKYVSLKKRAIAQLVDICIIMQGTGVRIPIIPLIHLKGGISSH